MLALAAGIDQIIELLAKQQPAKDWSELDWGGSVQITQTGGEGGTSEVVFPKPSSEKYLVRSAFAKFQLKLHEYPEYFPNDGTVWEDVYAKGGPMWLYLGNRALVMSLPEHIKRAMIEDVEQDSPKDANEMGADILKFPGETGPGGVAMKVAG
jgi:hypothetical protein